MASFKDHIRKFNKRYLNRLLGRLTRLPFGPFAMVRHRGRKSGMAYHTPIMAFPEAGGFLIALTYGNRVDWYRNLLAHQSGGLQWHGQDYAIEEVQALSLETALPRFPQPQRAVLGLVQVEDYAHLETRPAPSAKVD